MAGLDSYTKLLIQSNSTNGSTTFTDLSASGHPLTLPNGSTYGPKHSTDVSCPLGLATVISAFSPYGSIANTDTSSSDFIYGSDQFVAEFFIRPTSSTAAIRPLAGIISFYLESNYINATYYYSGSEYAATVSGGATKPAQSLLTINAWNHVAIVRDSTDFRLYINGAKVAYNTLGASRSLSATMTVGICENANSQFYLQQVSISVGTNRGYTGDTITVPTVPFSDSTPITGSGNIDIPCLTVSGTGEGGVVSDGNIGSVDIPSLDISGSGLVGGSGEVDIPSMSVMTFGGNRGEVDIPAFFVSGTGSTAINGSGSVDIPALTASIIFGSSGSIDIPILVVSGAGAVSNQGLGAVDIPVLAVAGSGTMAIVGSGKVDIPTIAIHGAGGFYSLNGSGSVMIPSMRCFGSGYISSPIVGSLDIPGITVRGFGTMLERTSNDGNIDIAAIVINGIATIEADDFILQYQR